MDPNSNNRYAVMKNQLQYFYLIDVDQIVDSIIDKIADKNDNPSDLLEVIFKHIFDESCHRASCYGSILDVNSHHIFFGENRTNKKIIGIFQLMYLTLQNNCILNSFFHELNYRSDSIDITGKNVPLIKKSVIDMILGDTHRKNIPGDVDSQFFDKRKNIYKSDISKNIYHTTILNDMNIANGQPDNNLPINVLQYLSPLANFMFIEDKCVKFCRSLNNRKNMTTKFNNLWNTFEEQKKNYKSNIDKLIFDSEMNAVFGFSFFSSILTFIDEIHDTSLSDKKSLKDLEGQLFNEIILQAANLPLFYNKEIFIKYVCCAFLNSRNVDYSYFDESAKAVVTRSASPLPKQQQVINGLDLMRRFFLILDYITIPLLYSLWEVVIYELNKKIKLFPDNIKIYRDYLSDNYDSINYPYINFPDGLLCEWGFHKFSFDHDLDNMTLSDEIKKYPIKYGESLIGKNIVKCILSPDSSKHSKENIAQLIESYCDAYILKEKRAPFLFLSKSDLMGYSPLSKLITSLLETQSSPNGTLSLEEETLFISHKNALYEYLFSKK